MSPAPIAAGRGKPSMAYRPEQRLHQRYPISFELDYKLMHRGRVERQGSGRTLNIGSGGVLLQTEGALPPGEFIELIIHWPFLLEGVCPLKLVMRGRIVRSDGRGVAVKAKHHEFRTAGARVQKNRPSDGRVRSIAG
jgi:PilZ domain